MLKSLLPWIAILLSVLALTLGWTSESTPETQARSVEPARPSTDLEQRVVAIEESLAELRQELAWLARAPRETSPTPDPQAREAEEDLERIAKIEETLRRLEAAEDRGARVFDLMRQGSRGKDADEALEASRSIDEWQRLAMDPNSTEEEQVQALRALRGKQDVHGNDARDPIVPAMVELAGRTTDARLRGDIWRQLSGNTHPALRQPLLDSLAFDQDKDVREEAAETLADFLPDATVEQALRYAAQNDAHDDVREEAQRALSRR